jgi:hypothetical protein
MTTIGLAEVMVIMINMVVVEKIAVMMEVGVSDAGISDAIMLAMLLLVLVEIAMAGIDVWLVVMVTKSGNTLRWRHFPWW